MPNRTSLALLFFVPHLAFADGAFPLANQVFLPSDHPHRVILGSNWGVFISEDDGATWRQVIESNISDTQLIWSYQLGPDGTLYALGIKSLAVSTDEGCTWSAADWDDQLYLDDLFPDPNDPTRVLAISRTLDVTVSRVLRSHDHGVHFDETLFEEAAGELQGVEVPLNAPSTVYITGKRAGPDGGALTAYVGRSTDDGRTFAIVLHPELGQLAAGILLADPADSDRVWLRVGYLGQDSLVLAVDGGTRFIPLLQLPDTMAAFARGPDETLWLGDLLGHLWSSADGGFALEAGPQTLCLGARGSQLYSCGQLIQDGFDLGRSDDRGRTFKGLLNISTGSGVVATDCSADAGPIGADAGTRARDGGVIGGDGASSRCGCHADEGAAIFSAALVLNALHRVARRMAAAYIRRRRL